MRSVGGIWIPDAETWLAGHLEDTAGYGDHYDDDLISFAATLPRRRTAIDVGANIGLWSRRLVSLFDFVHAFEPLDVARECFVRNVPPWPNVFLHPAALGDRNGTTELFLRPGTLFKTYVGGASGSVEMRMLDSFEFTNVDFIKVDCEGFDYFVLEGARKTILRERPLVIFEAKPGVSFRRYRLQQDSPHRFIESLGYAPPQEVRGNFICYPKEAL